MKSAYLSILGSQAGAQFLIVLATPLLTRFYDREDFGLFGIASTAALIISTTCSFRLDQSLHIAPSPEEHYIDSRRIIRLTTVSLALPLFLLFYSYTTLFNSALVLIFAVSHAYYWNSLTYLNRKQVFQAVATVNLVLPLVFLLGLLGPTLLFKTNSLISFSDNLGINPLLFWQTCSHLVAALLGWWFGKIRLINAGKLTRKKTCVGSFIRKHMEDLRFLVPARVLSIVSLNIAILGSGVLFGGSTAGLIVVAQRISRLPVSMIGDALNEVLRSTIGQHDSVKLKSTFQNISIITFIAGCCLIAFAWIVPVGIFNWALGKGWSDIKTVLMFTSIAGAFQLVGTSVACMLTTYAKRAEFYVNLSLVIVGLASIAIASILDFEILQYLTLHSLTASIVYLFAYILAFRVKTNVKTQ